MGNDRVAGSPVSYPAAVSGVIAVGATTDADAIATFSNQGGHISLSAPGEAIWSTLPTYSGQLQFQAILQPNGTVVQGAPYPRETDYAPWDGTSMASPHVAAAVALLLGNKGLDTPTNVRSHLMAKAVKVPAMAGQPFDNDFGAGRLDLWNLLA
jgi:subtilisin family serine protease